MIPTTYNPDVLTCLANLSNDEVFTPPTLVNDMLDLLPADLWSNPDARFLDPVSKTGVFLREIAKRLMKGLETHIPDKQDRINHIYSKQLFGIAITELTSLLSRRSVYCSKTANGRYSICTTFTTEQGNILYERMQHTWQGGKCTYCGASQEVYDREDALETYAYNFIHTDNPENRFNMKFDVIIGNPPYQLTDGGAGPSAKPLYHKFIQHAKKLNPTFLSMIIPARWFSGGRGLDEFRDEMLKDKRLKVIHDFPNASDCFPGIEIKGGVCYFLWHKDNDDLCTIFTHKGDEIISSSKRKLLEKGAETFIRFNEAVPILRKVQGFDENSFASLISANDPFGFDVREDGSFQRIQPKFKKNPFNESVDFYYSGWQRTGFGYIDRKSINKNIDWIDKYKIFITKAYGAGESFPHQILNVPIIGNPNSCCSETYIVIGPFDNALIIENVVSYIKSKFFRFLVSLKKITQEARRGVYEFVPIQDFTEPWTDEKLYKKYGLTPEEIAFIESMIRPMKINPKQDLHESTDEFDSDDERPTQYTGKTKIRQQ